MPGDTDMLLYEGLLGARITEECHIVQFADLLIGVVPLAMALILTPILKRMMEESKVDSRLVA